MSFSDILKDERKPWSNLRAETLKLDGNHEEVTLTTGAAYAGNIEALFTSVGGVVTAEFSVPFAAFGAAGYIISSVIPTAYIPKADVSLVVPVKDDGTHSAGVLTIGVNGTVTIGVLDAGGIIAFGGAGTIGIGPFIVSVSYKLKA